MVEVDENDSGSETEEEFTSRRREVVTPKVKKVKFAPEEEVIERKRPADLPYRQVIPLQTGDLAGGKIIKDLARRVEKLTAEEKAYRLRAPIQEEGSAENVMRNIHDTVIPIKLKDLLGISQELRELEKAQMTRIRQPIVHGKPPKVVFAAQEAEAPDSVEDLLGVGAVNISTLPSVESAFMTTVSTSSLPAGSLVMSDPVVQYLETDQRWTSPPVFYTGKESAPIRVLYPNINGKGEVESIVDSGSQVVSMSLPLAQTLHLAWDPDIRIYMQSASGEMTQSEGLAKNVPFKFGDVVIHLQVHVMTFAPYNVLLGRPFDVLTESTVKNRTSGGQELTLRDPNSGRRVTVSTYDRKRSDGPPEPLDPTESMIKKLRKEDMPGAQKTNLGQVPPGVSGEPAQGFRNSSMN